MAKIKDNAEKVKKLRKYSGETENALINSTLITTNFVNVLFWFMRTTSLHGIGLDLDDKPAQIVMSISPYLVLWARTLEDVEALRFWKVANTNLPIEPLPMLSNLKVTGISPIDLALPSNVNEPWYAFKFPVNTFFDCRYLHNELMRDSCTRYIKVPGIWNVKFFLALHIYITKGIWSPIFNVYMNSKLEFDSTLPSPLTHIFFDFETISHENTRFPTGTNQTDMMFSASIIIDEKLYTLVNLPVNEKVIPNAVMSETLEHEILIFHNEVDLITKVCELFDSIGTFYICIGFNSTGYDIPYLAQRLTYLSMPQVTNICVYDSILSYGKFMIHIDLYLMAKKFSPELSSHSLRSVSEAYLSNVTKDDFNAVEIRHSYREMIETGKVADNVATICKYNDQDTYILYRIASEHQYQTFLPDITAESYIPLIRIAICGVDEYVSTKTVLDAIKYGTLLISHPRHTTSSGPTHFISCDAYKLGEGDKPESYPGGFNYFSKTGIHNDVYMFDFVSYYPYLIDKLNLSYENIIILTAQVIRTYNITGTFYRYCTHAPELARRYINGTLDNGSTIEDLSLVPDDERIIVHVPKVVGIATTILRNQNILRNKCKENKKTLDSLIDTLSSIDSEDLPEESAVDESAFAPISVNLSDFFASATIRIPLLSKQQCKKMDQDQLEEYINLLTGETARQNCLYRSLKIVNSSIGGGLLGSHFGALKSRALVSATTALGRKWLIDVTKYANSLSPKIELLLADTDSMFLSNVTPALATQICQYSGNVGLTLNFKIYPTVVCLRKKCYIYVQSSQILTKSIQTKGGPALWTETIQYIINKYVIESAPMKFEDVFDIWWLAYYKAHQAAKAELSNIFIKHRIGKDIADYKSPPKLITRVLKNEPGYKFQDSYYSLLVKGAKLTDRVELHTDTEIGNVNYAQANLMHFYNNISASMYHIISTLIAATYLKAGVCYKLPASTFDDIKVRVYDYFNSMLMLNEDLPIDCPSNVYFHQMSKPSKAPQTCKRIKVAK